jgi:hypothetical protein
MEIGANDTNDETDSIDEILDTNWIDHFKAAESVYNEFYKEPVTSINIYLMYVNKENELEHIHNDKCFINENGLLTREMIISLIKRHQLFYKIRYKLLSLIKYNIDLEPIEIKDFVNEDNTFSNKRFIQSEKYLEDIRFNESIHMFQDLNALFFLFYEEKQSLHNTKRIHISSQSSHKTKRNTHNKKNLKINKQIR